MPTYHNTGGGYPNISATPRQSKLDGNQNHHTIPSNITSHNSLVGQQNATATTGTTIQQNVSSNLHPIPLSANIPPHSVPPNVTSHVLPSHGNPTTPALILPSNSGNITNNPPGPLANQNPRHEVKLNAMP